jgi:DNA repair photolyase
MRIHEITMTTGISRSLEFERKKLASYAVNIGTKCGHDCRYCSTGAMLRMHVSFKRMGENPFGFGYSIVDPDTPERVSWDARRIQSRGLVQLCTVVDAWAPEAQNHDLGRRCLEAILSEPGWTVRILTKNTAVRKDFDLIRRYRDRVLVGLSLTASAENSEAMAVVEEHASPNSERMAVMKEAHTLGLRTYGMLCPILPGMADQPDQIEDLIQFVVRCGAEEIFMEPVNSRGPSLKNTQEALEIHGFRAHASAIQTIRNRKNWSRYVVNLVKNAQVGVRTFFDIEKFRFLLYPSPLQPGDWAEIQKDDAGVIWLGKEVASTDEMPCE